MKDSVKKIIALHNAGMKNRDIALELGCSRPNVTQALRRHCFRQSYIRTLDVIAALPKELILEYVYLIQYKKYRIADILIRLLGKLSYDDRVKIAAELPPGSSIRALANHPTFSTKFPEFFPPSKNHAQK